jgi:hypothetical protein
MVFTIKAMINENAQNVAAASIISATTTSNLASIAFHKSLGMMPIGKSDHAGIPIIKDYSGPGADRIVLQMKL